MARVTLTIDGPVEALDALVSAIKKARDGDPRIAGNYLVMAVKDSHRITLAGKLEGDTKLQLREL